MDLRPLLGVLREQQQRVGDRKDGGVEASREHRADQQRGLLGRDHAGVGLLPDLCAHAVGREDAALAVGEDPLRRAGTRLDVLAVQLVVGAKVREVHRAVGEQVFATSLAADADGIAEYAQRELLGDVVHEVDFLSAEDGVRQLGGVRVESRPQLAHLAWCDHRGHGRAHRRVARGVRLEDALGTPVRRDVEVGWPDAGARDERFVVHEQLAHGLKAGEGVHAVLLEPYGGPGIAHPFEQRVRIRQMWDRPRVIGNRRDPRCGLCRSVRCVVRGIHRAPRYPLRYGRCGTMLA